MKHLVFVLLMLGLHTVTGFSIRSLKEPIKKCTVPKRFEGKFKVKLEMRGVVVATGTGTLHADETIGRGALYEKVYSDGKTTEVNVFIHSNSHSAYYARPAYRMCQKKPLMMPFLLGTLPKGDTPQIRRGKLGGAPVQIWDVGSTRAKRDITAVDSMRIYLDEHTCMPVRFEFPMLVYGQRLQVTEDWYDLKKGIVDSTVFDLPSYCVKESANRWDLAHDWHVHHAMARYQAHRHLFD